MTLSMLVLMLPACTPAKEIPVDVVLVSMDGTSTALVEEEWERLPTLSGLADSGGYLPLTLRTASDTKAGHGTLLTGYLAEVTGVHDWDRWDVIPPGLGLFERLREAFAKELDLFWVSSKPGMLDFGEDDAFFHVAAPCNVRFNERQTIAEQGLTAQETVQAAGERPFMAFVHFGEIDNAGHQDGERSELQRETLRAADAELGKILEQLDSRERADRTIVIVTTDHGFDPGTNRHQHRSQDVWVVSNLPLVGGEAQDQIPWTILSLYGLDLASYLPAPDLGPFEVAASER